MSAGFKALVGCTMWLALLLALLPRALSQPTCSADTVGRYCEGPAGFDAVCKEFTGSSGATLYGCFTGTCPTAAHAGKDCYVCGYKGACILYYQDGWSNSCNAPNTVTNIYMGVDDACGPALAGKCLASAICTVTGSAESDPLITGFDGNSFHFDETGEFTLLSSGDGFRVDVTFAGAATAAKEEKAWTSSVRIMSPNGDMVACALPDIQPNTSRVQVTSIPAQSTAQVVLLSPINPSMELAEMNATAVLSEGGQVTGCQVTTSRMQATVYQVSGYEQAQLHPEEAWAAPYTWLNTDIKLTKPLPGPVTGILGATYLLDKGTEADFMRALEGPPGGVQAGVVGESGSRLLAGAAAGPFFLESSIVGISRSWRGLH